MREERWGHLRNRKVLGYQPASWIEYTSPFGRFAIGLRRSVSSVDGNQLHHPDRHLKWLLLAGLLSAYGVASVLPPSCSLENGPLEWAGVGILAFGFAVCAGRARKASALREQFSTRFWSWTLMPWLVMIGRELSWGRVLFPVGHDKNGPILIPMDELRYGGLIHATVVLLVVLWIGAVCRYRLYRLPISLIKSGQFPMLESALTVVAFLYTAFAERLANGQTVEELTECLAYFGLVVIALRMRPVARCRTSA